jgi:hypothetical protein
VSTRPGPTNLDGGIRTRPLVIAIGASLTLHAAILAGVGVWGFPAPSGPRTDVEGGITLLDLLMDASEPLYFQPAASVSVDERVLIINDLLCFNREADIDIKTNYPRLMVHESCQNLIYSLREWTGHDGQKGACKDPIDALGYLVVMQPRHVSSLTSKEWQKFNKCGSY